MATPTPTVLVVDDEERLRELLRGYLTQAGFAAKPFSPRELVARGRAMLRRPRASGQGNAPPAAAAPRVFGPLRIDDARHEVTLDGLPLTLTATEYGLLAALSAHPGRVFTRAQLLEQVWGGDYFGDDHVVDVHIANLRRKLAEDPPQPRLVETVRGVGYRLKASDAGGQ